MFIRKTIAISISVIMILSSTGHAADINFLRDEYKEAERHHFAAQDAMTKLRDLIANNTKAIALLKTAADELQAYREKLIFKNKQNMLKVAMAASLDIASLVSLVGSAGRVYHSVKHGLILLTTSIATEATSMFVQRVMSFDAPYNAKVGQLKTYVEALQPELDRIDEIRQMTKKEIQDYAQKTTGDELGETGAIFRKFDMLIKAVEKAEKKVRQLIMDLERMNEEAERDIERINKEDKRYRARMDELGPRIADEERRLREEEIQQKIDSMLEGIPDPDSAPFPQVAVPVKSDTERKAEYEARMREMFKEWVSTEREEAVRRIYKEYVESIRKVNDQKYRVNGLAKRIADENEKGRVVIERGIEAFAAERIRIHDREAQEALMRSPSAIAHQYGYQDDFLLESIERASPHLPSLITLCDEINEEIITLMALHRQAGALHSSISSAIDNGRTLYKKGYGDLATLPKKYLLTEDFKTALEGVEDVVCHYDDAKAIGTFLSLKKKVSTMADEESQCRRAIQDRKEALRKAFAKKMQTKENQYKEALQSIKKTITALQDVERAYGKYVNRVKDSPWAIDMGADHMPRFVIDNDLIVDELAKMIIQGELDSALQTAEQFASLSEAVSSAIDEHMRAKSRYEEALAAYHSHGYVVWGLRREGVPSALRSYVFDDRPMKELQTELAEGSVSHAVLADFPRDEDVFNIYESGMWKMYELYEMIEGDHADIISMAQHEFHEYIDAVRSDLKMIVDNHTVPSKVTDDFLVKLKELSSERQAEQQGMKAWIPMEISEAEAVFSVGDVRINGIIVPDTNTMFTVTPQQLHDGTCVISGKITPVNMLAGVAISLDNGTSWKTLKPLGRFHYSFTPKLDTAYFPQLKITDEYDETYVFRLVPTQSLGFKVIEKDMVTLAQDALSAVATAYERQDLSTFSRYVSKDFLGNRSFLEEGVRFDFDMFVSIRLMMRVNSMKKVGKDRYQCKLNWQKSHVVRQSGHMQQTTGTTTMVFTYEDGIMKLKNLRGDLIFATLSPEIAQASGKKMKEVDAIRKARDSRSPVQPGAATSTSTASTASSSPGPVAPAPSMLSVTQTSVTVAGHSISNAKGYDFETGRIVSMSSAANDLTFEGNIHFAGNCTFVPVNESFEQLTQAPTISGGMMNDPQPNMTYAFKTDQGHYGKLYIISVMDLGGPVRTDFKYVLQQDGSTTIASH